MFVKKWLEVSFTYRSFSPLLCCYYTGLYEFKERTRHKAPVIGDSLYLWGGSQLALPLVHDSPQKKQLASLVEVFSFSTGQWSSQLTRGTPPQGVIGYSCQYHFSF